MREIKFRGIDFSQLKLKNKKEWVYGDFYRQRSSTNIKLDADFFIRVNDLYDLKIIPETLSQYTGIKDCKGRKIYEGDIIEFELKQFETIKGSVEFDYGTFYIKTNNEEYDKILLGNMNFNLIEIVGNIFENKGLLQ